MHIQHVPQQIVDEFESILNGVNIVAGRLNRLLRSKGLFLVDRCFDKAASSHGGAHGVAHFKKKWENFCKANENRSKQL